MVEDKVFKEKKINSKDKSTLDWRANKIYFLTICYMYLAYSDCCYFRNLLLCSSLPSFPLPSLLISFPHVSFCFLCISLGILVCYLLLWSALWPKASWVRKAFIWLISLYQISTSQSDEENQNRNSSKNLESGTIEEHCYWSSIHSLIR